MKLALQLVTYNGVEYLPYLFSSLISQKDRDWVLYILDNSSSQRDRIRRVVAQAQKSLPIIYVESDDNIGFAGGHQKLFTMHDADLVQLVNPDVILSNDYIKQLRRQMFADASLGSIAGKLLRWQWDNGEPSLSTVVDSMGLGESSHGSVFDIGAGTVQDSERQSNWTVADGERQSNRDSGTQATIPFGVSGCLPMYRREAVEESSMNRELFDTNYHTYKEDVDLAYRLHRAGWQSGVLSDTVAHHRREVHVDTKREHISYASQFHSYRNHIWNLLTHKSLKDMVTRGWAIVPYEIAKLLYLLVHHPSIVVRTIKDTVDYYPTLKKKRSWYEGRTL